MTLGRWILWFVACGIGGAALDQLHTQLGVLSYRAPFFLGQAWWVAPNFGAGGVVFLAVGRAIARRSTIPMPSDREVAAAFVVFVAAYLASCFTFGHGWLALVLFLAVWSVRIARLRAKKPFVLYSAILAFLGCAYELTITSSGAYWFHHPDVWTVPAWLPGLYFLGAPAGLWIAKRLSR